MTDTVVVFTIHKLEGRFSMHFILSLFSRILTLVTILAVTFVLLHVIPGNPFVEEKSLPPEIERNLYEKYGLHKKEDYPFWEWVGRDLVSYGKQITQFRLGPSLKYADRDVSQIIKEALPASMILGSLSLVGALLSSILTAVFLSRYKISWLEDLFSVLSSITISMPSFIRSIILISVFALTLKWLPPALWEGPSYWILPVIALGITPYFMLTELLYSEIKNEQKKQYVRTAQAKGVKEIKVLYKHVLRNSFNPILAILGPIATYLLTGSFVVETIFSIPGMGRHFVLAVSNRDYFLVMGITFVIASVLIFFNWLTDGISKILDPRIS